MPKPVTSTPASTVARRAPSTDAFPKTTAATKALQALAKESNGKTAGANIDAIIEKQFGAYSKMSPDQAREASVALNTVKSEFKGFALTHLKKQLELLQDRSS